MITLTKGDSQSGGQGGRHFHLTGVLAGDIVFAMCSYYQGGNPYLTLAGTADPSHLIGESLVETADGEIICKVAEALDDGEIEITINSDSNANLDCYAVVFRPSERTENVAAYIKTAISPTRVWTDSLDVLEGEYILCAQYSSGAAVVRSTPAAGDKAGTATIVVADYDLPEGSTSKSNSFMELLRVTGDGTFSYYGPNPTVMRVTIQGDPALLAAVVFRVGAEV